jgi:hypothetical protein
MLSLAAGRLAPQSASPEATEISTAKSEHLISRNEAVTLPRSSDDVHVVSLCTLPGQSRYARLAEHP